MKAGDKVRVVRDSLKGSDYYSDHEGDTGRIVAIHQYTDPVTKGFPNFPYEVRLDGRDYSSMFSPDELEVIE